MFPMAAGPTLMHLGSEDEGGGVYRHDYVLSNVGGDVDLYDLEYDGDFHHGWFKIEGPDDWHIVYNGLNWTAQTSAAPCNVDQQMFGFSIRAGTPTVEDGSVTFTDVSHMVVAAGPTVWPEAAGPTFTHLGYEDEGGGVYRHDYVLSNVGGDVDLYDVEYDGEFHHGWFEITGPNDWNLVYIGLTWRLETQAAPCNVGQQLFGFSIRAGTPTVDDGSITYTDSGHSVVAAGPTVWPMAAGDCKLLPGQDLTGVWKGDAQWGDIDGDGDVDLVISGETQSGMSVTEVYLNEGGFLMLWPEPDLVGVVNAGSGNLALGDYDGDGDLDLAVAGLTDGSAEITRIHRNDGSGIFTLDPAQVLLGVANASLAWGDYDNDGDLDLLVMGNSPAGQRTELYENEPQGTLTLARTLTGLGGGSADWVDFDGDGDLDLMTTGYDGASRRTIFYLNDPVGALTDDGDHGLPSVNLSDAAWGDYDSDGDLDLALTGEMGSGGPRMAGVYENDGVGNLTEVASLLSIYRSSLAWGDYDADGDLDLALCGYDGSGLHTRVYEKRETDFQWNTEFAFPGVREGSVSWADVDADGDLDLFMTGADWAYQYARVYNSADCLPNDAPLAPTDLSCEQTPDGLYLSWTGATDSETPAAGLCYALRVGMSPGASDVVSGTYGSPLMGNVGPATEVTLDVPSGTYYWSVRAVDSGLTASSWSAEEECSAGGCPLAEPLLPEEPVVEKIRYITMVPQNAGRQTALRVTLANMPPLFEAYDGCQLWVSGPGAVTEASGSDGSSPPPTFMLAGFSPDPDCRDWGSIGQIDVTDNEVVPSALYEVQAIDCECDFGDESNYSAPLPIATSRWGDLVGDCGVTPCTPPDGRVDFIDISACVEKFKNSPVAPRKARADVASDNVDRKIDFVDISWVVEAFRGNVYPFDGPDECP